MSYYFCMNICVISAKYFYKLPIYNLLDMKNFCIELAYVSIYRVWQLNYYNGKIIKLA